VCRWFFRHSYEVDSARSLLFRPGTVTVRSGPPSDVTTWRIDDLDRHGRRRAGAVSSAPGRLPLISLCIAPGFLNPAIPIIRHRRASLRRMAGSAPAMMVYREE